MTERKILVVGGTGLLGSAVVRRLEGDGLTTRVFTRRPREAHALFGTACDVAQGDVDDAASLSKAMEGCDGVHLSLDGGPDPDLERRGAENVARAASGRGVRRITLLSGASVCVENAWFPGTKAKLAAEAAVRGCGIPWAAFRASFFMESLPRFVRGKRASVVGTQPNHWHWVAAGDYARMVSAAHASVSESGVFTVLGPEAFTICEALERYCSAVSPGTKVGGLPFWIAGLMTRLPGTEDLRTALPFFRYTSVATETGDPERTNALFGAPRTTLDGWCRERRR